VAKTTGFYPVPRAGIADIRAVGHGGGALLTSTVLASGLDVAMSQALGPWRKAWAIHDPGKILIDLALTLALCLVPDRGPRGRSAHMDGDARPGRPSGPQVGTQTPAMATVRGARHVGPTCPRHPPTSRQPSSVA
jgi:hypothetical protein